MDLIQKASKLGYKHYTEFTVGELDKLPISNNSKQIEYCFLQKWLREVHNIDCNISLNLNNEYSCHIFKNKLSINKDKDIWNGEGITPNGKDYEVVLEEGLQEALKLIPDKK